MRLVISDAHEGLKAAIAAVLLGAAWQACRVYFLRSVLTPDLDGSAEMALAAIQTIFAQPDRATVVTSSTRSQPSLPRFPTVAALLVKAKEDVTAFAAFPVGHWRKAWSTNPLERVNGVSSLTPKGCPSVRLFEVTIL